MAPDLSNKDSDAWMTVFDGDFHDSFVEIFFLQFALKSIVSVSDIKDLLIRKKKSLPGILHNNDLALLAWQLSGNIEKWKSWHKNHEDPTHECHRQKNRPGRFGTKGQGASDGDEVFRRATIFFQTLRQQSSYERLLEKVKEGFPNTKIYKMNAPLVCGKANKGVKDAAEANVITRRVPTFESFANKRRQQVARGQDDDDELEDYDDELEDYDYGEGNCENDDGREDDEGDYADGGGDGSTHMGV